VVPKEDEQWNEAVPEQFLAIVVAVVHIVLFNGFKKSHQILLTPQQNVGLWKRC